MPNRPPQLLADFLRRQTLAWLVPLVVMAAITSGYSVYQVHRSQSAEVKATAGHVAEDISRAVERRHHGLLAIAAAVSSDGDPHDLKGWYKNGGAYDRIFDTPIVVADAQRRILMHTRRLPGEPLPNLPNPPGASAFQEALVTNETRVGDVVVSGVMKVSVLPIVIPLNRDRAVVGLVPLSIFEQILQRQRLPEGWHATVFDSVGSPIASTTKQQLGFSGLESPRRSQAMIAATPWSVVIEVGSWPFYRPHLQVASALLAGICLAFAGAAWATRRSSLALLRSVNRLSHKVPLLDPRTETACEVLAAPKIVEIEAARSELKRLGNAQYQAEETERSRIARELHDGIQQDVAAMHINVNLALSRLGSNSQAHEPLSATLESAKRVLKGLQSAVNDLRPPSFESGGLVVALEELTQQFTALTGTQVELEVVGSEGQLDALPGPIVDCLYRIAQECLNNVRKHAQASFVHIELDILVETEVRLRIADDGVGLESHERHKLPGFGLRSMVERASALNGSLVVWQGSKEGGGDSELGTTVLVTLPLTGLA